MKINSFPSVFMYKKKVLSLLTKPWYFRKKLTIYIIAILFATNLPRKQKKMNQFSSTASHEKRVLFDLSPIGHGEGAIKISPRLLPRLEVKVPPSLQGRTSFGGKDEFHFSFPSTQSVRFMLHPLSLYLKIFS